MIEEYSDVIEFLFSKNIEIESIYSFISNNHYLLNENRENLIDNLLKILVNYQVTPVATGDIISDFKKCPELIFSMTK